MNSKYKEINEISYGVIEICYNYWIDIITRCSFHDFYFKLIVIVALIFKDVKVFENQRVLKATNRYTKNKEFITM